MNPSEVFDDATRARIIQPVTRKKKVAVVGGGPGGMYAAILLADRGHQVTLYEQKEKLGGQLCHADMVDFKWPMADYIAWLERQLRKRENVTLHLGTRATPELLAQENYDDAIIAIGPQFRNLNIPGLTEENSCHVLEDLKETADTLTFTAMAGPAPIEWTIRKEGDGFTAVSHRGADIHGNPPVDTCCKVSYRPL